VSFASLDVGMAHNV